MNSVVPVMILANSIEVSSDFNLVVFFSFFVFIFSKENWVLGPVYMEKSWLEAPSAYQIYFPFKINK